MNSIESYDNLKIIKEELLKNIEDSIKKHEYEIDQEKDEVTRKMLREKFISSSKFILASLKYFGNIKDRNDEKFVWACTALSSNFLREKFETDKFGQGFNKELLVVRTYLAFSTAINLCAIKAYPWEKAEMLNRLCSGMEDIPENLVAEWITKQKQEVLNGELELEFGKNIVDKIRRLLNIKYFVDACNTPTLRLLSEKLNNARTVKDLINMTADILNVKHIKITFSLPEEMTHQFSFLDGDGYPGAELSQLDDTIIIKVDIRIMNSDNYWRSDTEILIARLLCDIVLKCMETHDFPSSLHQFLIKKVAPLIRMGGVRGFKRTKWDNVFAQAELKQ